MKRMKFLDRHFIAQILRANGLVAPRFTCVKECNGHEETNIIKDRESRKSYEIGWQGRANNIASKTMNVVEDATGRDRLAIHLATLQHFRKLQTDLNIDLQSEISIIQNI